MNLTRPPDEKYRKFQEIFKVRLNKYLHPLFGFDIVQFDEEVVQSPDGKSVKETLVERYGREASNLIEYLVGFKTLV